jgi:hypothetical protein
LEDKELYKIAYTNISTVKNVENSITFEIKSSGNETWYLESEGGQIK